MKFIPTRSVEECQLLVSLWDDGKHDDVRKMLGGAEPSEKFLRDFRVARPKKARLKRPREEG